MPNCGRKGRDERPLKRLAMGIVIQLPENSEEALLVLRYAEELIRDFVDKSRTRSPRVIAAQPLFERAGR